MLKRHCVHYFRVTVIDVNDNAPKMDVPQSCVSISEFHDLQDIIYVIKAKDADDPTTPNGRVKMRITSGNELGAALIPDDQFDVRTKNSSVLTRNDVRNTEANGYARDI